MEADYYLSPQERTRKQALFTRLRAVYDNLQDLQADHNRTAFKCTRSGGCCQVGLTLHHMECENLARSIEARHRGDPEGLQETIDKLKLAFGDPDWTHGNITGQLMCANWDGEGCGIYMDRPAVCRMYGVILTVDEFCPRVRLTSDEPFLFTNPKVDGLVREFYSVVDTYGKMFPHLDYSIFMPAGVLACLLQPDELAEFRASTPPRFWKRSRGYRTQYQFSRAEQTRMEPDLWARRTRHEEKALRKSPFLVLPSRPRE